ncbi:MAG: ABC transporter ATP-binding protein [Desulfobacula sp.]|nr:ABC transporter ATP-binding protein [Desulfobacula sp.]MBT7260405.1 ABC transporter ATP-binding protein [Desulfobacula sp.]
MEKKNKILNIEEIQTYYGVSHVIQGLSMHVEKQEAVSILGRNGVGKTTTLRSIMGLTPPRSGNIYINGARTTKWQPHKISKMGVAYVPAERHIFPGLSVEENLMMAARPGNGNDAWTLEKVCDHFPVLAERTKQDGSTLSGGEQQMLAIGRALISNPEIIIMDEPSQGLSPLLVQMITDVVLKFCIKSGITMLIVEQNYRMALKVASRHYLMGTKGEIVKVASTKELVDNPDIIQSHLSV